MIQPRYDPALGRFTDLVLTTARQAETASRTRIGAGRVLVMDRGCARVRSLRAVLGEGSDFITRIGWRSLVLHDANGQRIDIMSLLTEGASPSEHPVWVKGIDRGLRLVIQSLPPDIAERQRTRRARKASKKSHKRDARTAKAAGFAMLLTSLSKQTSATERSSSAAVTAGRWRSASSA
jgi:hypothetical protein